MDLYCTKITVFLTILLMPEMLIFVPIAADTPNVNNEELLILTNGCNIPAYPLISDRIKRLIEPTKTTNCSENIHLLDNNSTHIWIVEESLDLYNVFSKNDFYCCYQHFYAGDNIEQIIYGNCLEFKTIIEAAHEFTRVECFYLDTTIYNDFFLFSKFTKTVQVSNMPRPAFNVLLFGMESMSRMNFMRMMPRTSQFLKEKGSIQLLGYNKVGDNSFPNLFALLLGKSFKHVKNSCIVDNVINGSECVFLWTKFKKAGYDTALGSDSVAGLLDTYEYSLPYIPTDFYLQPFLFETRNVFKNTHYGFHKCLRNKYLYKLLLHWSAELLKRSGNKMFGIFWEESISHENFNLPQSIDDDYYSFLKELENSKYLDDSIIILFSDHGMRWGEIVQTEQGRIENRLPLFEIVFPIKFQRQYRVAFNNIKLNQFRLTSPFDLHETLSDLVYNNIDDYKIKMRSKQISRSASKMSLFLPISKERTCKTIGISDHWCTCQENNRDDMDEQQRMIAANYIIQHINRLLLNEPKCHQLRVSQILNATVTKEKTNNILRAYLVLRTSPGGGIFDGTIYRKGKEWYISDAVTRLNLYRYTSQCIPDNYDNVKMYCTCK